MSLSDGLYCHTHFTKKSFQSKQGCKKKIIQLNVIPVVCHANDRSQPWRSKQLARCRETATNEPGCNLDGGNVRKAGTSPGRLTVPIRLRAEVLDTRLQMRPVSSHEPWCEKLSLNRATLALRAA